MGRNKTMMHITVSVNVSGIPEEHRSQYINYIRTHVAWAFSGHGIEVITASGEDSITVSGVGGYGPNEAEIAYRKMEVRGIISDAVDMYRQ
jgi:hypothetical protein